MKSSLRDGILSERFLLLWAINNCFKCDMVESKGVYGLLLSVLIKVYK